jgi:integrase
MAIPQALCDVLQELKKEQDRKKALLGDKWFESGFIFTDWCGHVMHPHTPTKQFDKFLKKYGFRHLKFHGLRHSSATYLLSNGCDIKTVSKRLGHTSIDTTNIYVHALAKTDKAAADCFDLIGT